MKIGLEYATIIRDKLQNDVNVCSRTLNAYPRLGNGLTTDCVKDTEKWQSDYDAYNKAFAAIRDFNKIYVAEFKQELRAARNAKMNKKNEVPA